MSKRHRKNHQSTVSPSKDASGSSPESPDGNLIPEPTTIGTDNPTQSEGHNVCSLIWLPPVIEEHEQIATWHCWYSECRTYRVIRVESLIGAGVHFAATLGSKPFSVIRNELNTLEKAIRAVEQDWEKAHPGQLPEGNSYSILAEAEEKNLHSAKIDLPTAKKSDRVISTDSVVESKMNQAKEGKNMATKTATATGKVQHVGKAQAVALLQAAGLKAIKDKSPLEKIEAEINSLLKKGADSTDVEKLTEDGHNEEAALLEEVLETLKAKGSIEIVPPDGEERPVDRNGSADEGESETVAEPEEEAPSYDPQARETAILNVDDLVFADYNPGDRTDEKSSAMKSFAKQLLADGKIYQPVIVRTDRKTVVEGHKRLTACRMNKWPKIEAVITDDDPEQVYATVNATVKKHTGRQTLEVYLQSGGKAVLSKVGKKIKDMQDLAGKPMLKKLAQKGLSARTVNTAVRVCKYCEMMDDDSNVSADDVRKVLDYMLAHDKCIGKIMRAMAEKQPAKALKKAIDANKPLVFKFQED